MEGGSDEAHTSASVERAVLNAQYIMSWAAATAAAKAYEYVTNGLSTIRPYTVQKTGRRPHPSDRRTKGWGALRVVRRVSKRGGETKKGS